MANIALWICQGFLALVFAGSGVQKLTRSKSALVASGQTGVQAYPIAFVRFIAVCELLGAEGLIAPRVFGIAPWLVPLAAGGLAVIMVGAAYSHWRLHEPRSIAVNALLFALCMIVVCGR